MNATKELIGKIHQKMKHALAKIIQNSGLDHEANKERKLILLWQLMKDVHIYVTK